MKRLYNLELMYSNRQIKMYFSVFHTTKLQERPWEKVIEKKDCKK